MTEPRAELRPPVRPEERVAVVGSGIAGLASAYLLDPARNPNRPSVTLFEAADRLGGHANTVTVTDSDGTSFGVDTGFIVHNDRNYPNLTRLFEELSVPVQDSEMSFAVTDHRFRGRDDTFTYRATNLATLMADRRNLVRPEMWRMLADIVRFYRSANRLLATHDEDGSGTDSMSLGRFLSDGRYSKAFIDLHLIPMGAAVWSADPTTFDRFPAVSLFRFLANHGLLGVGDRPQWRTVIGGSRTYVDAAAAALTGPIRLGSPVRCIRRTEGGVQLDVGGPDGGAETFDRVILACHSDQALNLLEQPTEDEKEVLGAITYQPNRATLHTDISLMPPVRAAWAAWNYDRGAPGDPSDRATLTYDLTNLQRLGGSERYLVSLNSDHRINPDRVIASVDYAHPVFDASAIAAQRRFDEIDGADRVHFCGAYWSYGFHEDGMASAVRVARKLGARW